MFYQDTAHHRVPSHEDSDVSFSLLSGDTFRNTAWAALTAAGIVIALALLLALTGAPSAQAAEGDLDTGSRVHVQAPDEYIPDDVVEDDDEGDSADGQSNSSASSSASAGASSSDDVEDDGTTVDNPNGSTSAGADEVGGFILQLVDMDMERATKEKIDVGVDVNGEVRIEQGDAHFTDMLFEVYDEEGGLAAKVKADETGLVALEEKNYLDLGTYYVKLNAESAKSLGYTANPKWFKTGRKVIIATPDAETDAGTCRVKAIRGGFTLDRVDGELFDIAGISDQAQGKASLADAEYLLFNASESTVIVNGQAFEPFNEDEGFDYEQLKAEQEAEAEGLEFEYAGSNRPIMTITTDELGLAATNQGSEVFAEDDELTTEDKLIAPFDEFTGLPWGTYLLKEKKASKGYRLDKEWTMTVQVHGAEMFNLDDVARATIKRGGTKITMKDGETADGKPQGDASLKGAVFEIVSANGENSTVVLDGKTYQDGDVVTTMTTNKKGSAASGKKVLPFGTYEIRMAKKKGTKSYAYDKKWSTEVTIKKNNKQVEPKKNKVFKANAIRGGITVLNVDADDKEPLSESIIEVVNESKAPVLVEGKVYDKGATILTIESDDDGVAATKDNVLPYGTYSLREKTASEGYELNKDWHPIVKVREADKLVDAGNLVDTPSPEPAAVQDNGRPSFLTTILPVVVIAIALVLIFGGIALAVRYRKSAREAQAGHPVAARTGTARGMSAVSSNKTYIEAAQEAREAVSPGKTFEELSRDAYGSQVNDAHKAAGKHGKSAK